MNIWSLWNAKSFSRHNLVLIKLFEPAPCAKAVLFSLPKRIFGGCGQTFNKHLLFVSEFGPAFYLLRAAFRAGFVVFMHCYNRVSSPTVRKGAVSYEDFQSNLGSFAALSAYHIFNGSSHMLLSPQVSGAAMSRPDLFFRSYETKLSESSSYI
jgi:hypothetical protein